MHFDVHDCESTQHALSQTYKQLSFNKGSNSIDYDCLSEMESIAYNVNNTWKRKHDLLFFVGEEYMQNNMVYLQWTHIPVCKNNDVPAFLPLHGLVVSNFHLGPTPVVFEELTDQEIQEIDHETEFVWYAKSLASVAMIRQRLGATTTWLSNDTMYFYDLSFESHSGD